MSACRRVFVVEDDAKIAGVLADYLAASDYAPTIFREGRAAIAAVQNDPPSAMILDLGLPGLDGLAVCQALRAFSAIPILMLTARVDEADRLAGLNTGADDYVCKPFSASEVVARIGAVIRRAEGRVTTDQSSNLPFVIDVLGQRIAWHGDWLPLSPAEFRIAAALMKQPGRVFTRDQLLERLGERSDESSDRAVDSHMKNIRKKLTNIDADACCFASVYGIGYRFDP